MVAAADGQSGPKHLENTALAAPLQKKMRRKERKKTCSHSVVRIRLCFEKLLFSLGDLKFRGNDRPHISAHLINVSEMVVLIMAHACKSISHIILI